MSSTEKTSVVELSPLKRALLAIEDLQARLSASERRRSEPIAIIGMGCRFPGGRDPSDFWSLLRNGHDAVSNVPQSRWNIEEFYDADPDAPGKMSTRWGGFLDNLDQFDAEFFGISPREAVSIDPQQRLLLEVAWEALENAGQGPRDLQACRTGVFVGLTSDEYAQFSFPSGNPSRLNAYSASGIARSVAGGRISYTLGIEGPNLVLDTACSSSLVALHTACLYLRMQECRMALAGGATVILSPEVGVAYSKAHMMAADGRCKAFDSRADGFVRGEGCGIVVLKRLSDAVVDRDHILAVIRGSAVNQDGRSSGLTVPNRKAQEAMLRSAMAQGGVRPEEIGYVEAHGTGTALGDPIEAHALATILGAGRTPDNPLVIGSVKTNIGHLEAAAGVAGLIKTVLSLQNEHIPPHLHFQQMNPHIDWGGVPVVIPVQGRPWPKGERRRLAGVSSFGFSGTNAHVILEEAPEVPARSLENDRPLHLLALSAKSESALRRLGERYLVALEHMNAPVADVCFTANQGRAHFEHRLTVVGSSSEQLREGLRPALPGRQVRVREGLQLAFLFPGQGAQYPGMTQQLYATQPIFRTVLDQQTDLLRTELEVPLRDALWSKANDLLDQTAYTQPALFAVEYALAELWRSWGIEPAVVLGHSVGEYVAACVAGVYSLADGLKLIARRARLMQAVSGNGAMTAVRAPEETVRAALAGLEARVGVAAFNAPDSLVISGYTQELEIAEQRLRDQGIQLRRLTVSHAFHSPQMREMEAAFEEVAREIQFAAPRLRMISSRTGRPVGREEMSTSEYWRRQVAEPVRFQQAMESLTALGSEAFLEVGPGTTLTSLGQECVGSEQLWLSSLRSKRGEWEQMLETLSQLYLYGAEVNWAGFDQPYPRRRVPLPTYPFERQRYWIATEQLQAPRVDFATKRDSAVLDQWFYRVGWHERESPLASAERVRRQWILVRDSKGLAEELAGRIRSAGCACLFSSHPADLGRIIATIDEPAVGIVDLRCLDAVPDSSDPPCEMLVNLVQEVAKIQRPDLLVWCVTRGAKATGHESDPVLPWQAPVWGLARTIASELASWGGIVDLDPGVRSEENAQLLWRHLASFDGEDQAAFRNGRRLVARLERYAAPAPTQPVFRADAAYLVTGGYGGLGLEISTWLARHGARNIVLMSRTTLPPRSEWAELSPADTRHRIVSRILEVERLGASVRSAAVDVADASALERFFRSYQDSSSTPIRGVIHAAGVARHALVSQSTPDDFRSCFRSKVDGSWLLHHALENMPLDFFVLFSSASAVLSSPRLGPYAAANAFLDGLAEYRERKGLPALTINWGAWTGIGMAKQPESSPSRAVTESDTDGMQLSEGLDCLGRLIEHSVGQVCILPMNWQKWARQFPAYMARPFFSILMKENPSASSLGGKTAPASGLIDQLNDAPESSRLGMLRERVSALALRVLGFPPDRHIDSYQALHNLGMDSLTALEFRNALSVETGKSLPSTFLFSYPAVEDITTYLMNLLFKPDQVPEPSVTVQGGARKNALDDIEGLSDEDVERMLKKRGAAQ